MSQDLKFFLFTPPCFEDLQAINVVKFIDDKCPQIVISKLLGYAIILFSFGLKLPQIQKVMKAKSGQGLSQLSLMIETFGFAINCTYFYRKAYPISTYGESFVILAQNILLLLLIWIYNKQINITNIIGLLIAILSVLLSFTDNVPMNLIEILYSSQILLILGSKLPQILTNLKNKSTGELAFITTALQFGGTCARLFTTFQEVPNMMVICLYALSLILNFIILFQFWLYWNNVDIGASKKNDDINVNNESKKRSYKNSERDDIKIKDKNVTPTNLKKRKRKE